MQTHVFWFWVDDSIFCTAWLQAIPPKGEFEKSSGAWSRFRGQSESKQIWIQWLDINITTATRGRMARIAFSGNSLNSAHIVCLEYTPDLLPMWQTVEQDGVLVSDCSTTDSSDCKSSPERELPNSRWLFVIHDEIMSTCASCERLKEKSATPIIRAKTRISLDKP